MTYNYMYTHTYYITYVEIRLIRRYVLTEYDTYIYTSIYVYIHLDVNYLTAIST